MEKDFETSEKARQRLLKENQNLYKEVKEMQDLMGKALDEIEQKRKQDNQNSQNLSQINSHSDSDNSPSLQN